MTCVRWSCYVALSALLNAAIASAVKVPTAFSAPHDPAPVRLNLISAAAPAPAPAQVRRARPPAPAVDRMVTQKQAPRNLTMAEKEKEPSPTETTAAAEEKPQESAATDTAWLPSDDGRAASTVIREANYRYQRPPAYPRRALELGQQGTVTLHAQVAPDGLPRALKVVQSSGYKLLDHAALTAVKKWEFEPVQVDGRAVDGWVRIPVRFVIEQ